MPKLGSKYKEPKNIVFSDFRSGGLNLSASDNMLENNEYSACKNIIYERNGGRLRSLEPFELVTTAAAGITSVFYSLSYGLFFCCGTSLYRRYNTENVFIGTLNGTESPVFCDFGEEDDRKLYIATGSVIQYYDGNSLLTQTPMPIDANTPSGDKWNSASDVLVRDGRLMCVRSGKDRMKFSGIGDPDNWQTEDTGTGDDIDVHTDADAIWLDVGYKQGGDIVRVVPVASDLIIFRSDGSMYRLSGTYPDWLLPNVGNNVNPVNRDSIASVGLDAMFIDRDRGLRRVSAVEYSYNDLAVTEKEGVKVNAWLAQHVDAAGCRMWSLPDRGEIWIRPNTGNSVLTWNNRYEGWNMLNLDTPVTAACEGADYVYVALGANLYRLSDSTSTPAIQPSISLTFAPIKSIDRVISEAMLCRIAMDEGSSAQIACSGYNWALSSGRNVSYQKLIGDSLAPVLTASGGTVTLDEFSLRTAEVM